MQDLGTAFGEAFTLIVTFDPDLFEIILLSLKVSIFAVALAALIGFPIGAALAIGRFPGRRTCLVLLNALMGLPPVVVGLTVYVVLSRSGPLGPLGLLYTPAAMVIAQLIVVVPIIAAVSRQTIEDLHREYDEQFRVLGLSTSAVMSALLWDARFSLMTALLAGFGRAIAEVGAVIIVGGNINHVTRVMTTAIALETSKGDLGLALGLGLILLALAVVINAGAMLVRGSHDQVRHA